ncbi:MAG: hypothetical protein H6Q70_1599 [Firmicutes bacterium]|nr:hypothetical protein [Bacillota bacterium]
MSLKIVAVGSNALIAEEVKNAVKLIIGEAAEIITRTTASVKNDKEGDLYVCAITQQKPLERYVKKEKISILDLRPTVQFFVQVSRIPAGEKVYIFNSNIHYAQLLKQLCETLKIKDVDFITIAYEDMPEEEVIEKLNKAKYIIGVGKLVEKEVLLSEQYIRYLHKDVKIIGDTRMATMQSACMLMQRVTELVHQITSKKIAVLATQMKDFSPSETLATDYKSTALEIEKLVSESNESILSIKENIMKSFAAQLSGNLVVDKEQQKSEESQNQTEMISVLERINGLKRE